MSPSSRALSRCVVTLSTSRCDDVEYPKGYDFASPEHRTPEERFGERIDAAAASIEVLFDELEERGRRFVSPGEPVFAAPRVGVAQRGDETCRVQLLCTPALTGAELEDVAQRVASLLTGRATPLEVFPEVTPHELPAQRPTATDAVTDPGEPPLVRPGRVASDDAPTRPHGVTATRRRDDVATRPEGVMAIPSRKKPGDDAEGSEEVTDPQRRAEVPTRPEGVMAIPPRKKPRNDG